jgi:hypothetical protein
MRKDHLVCTIHPTLGANSVSADLEGKACAVSIYSIKSHIKMKAIILFLWLDRPTYITALVIIITSVLLCFMSLFAPLIEKEERKKKLLYLKKFN